MTSEKLAGTTSRVTLNGLLSFFAEVRPGETKMALLMTLNIFLILTSYLIAKVVREPLILTGGGAEMKSYASAVQVILLLGVVRMYTICVCKVNRRKLINFVILFFSACLIAFWLILSFGGSFNGIIYYFWVGIFSLLVIAQFWSFANDIYTPEQGKRLFVILAFGASAGGVFGPMLSGLILDMVGLYNLLLVSAGMLLSSLLLTNYIEARTFVDSNHCDQTAGQETGEKVSHRGGMRVILQSKYLLLIAILVLLTNFVNSTGEYILGKSVVGSAAGMFVGDANAADLRQAFIGRFYANFYSIVGILGLIIQLLIVSRVIKYLGVSFALMTLPLIAMFGYVAMAVFPLLGLIRWAKMAENSTDYSLNNTVRHILFLPTSREEKYKAKVAIDTFFVRAGDVFSAALVFVGINYFTFGVSEFASVCAVLAATWLVLAFFIGKENRKLVKG